MYYEDRRPVGTIFLLGDDEYYEIFGLELARERLWDESHRADVCHALLRAALNHCKPIGARYVTFLCEEEMKHIVAELGFWCVGQYVCYTRQI